MENRYAIGVDIGGSHLCSAVVNLVTGRLSTEPITTPVDSQGSASAVIDSWCSNIDATAAAFDGKICGIGLAIPGPFDYRHGVSTIEGVNKYDAIFGLDIRQTLGSRLATEARHHLAFVNDASAFALGECLGGAGADSRRVVALTLGTGVGSGFVEDKRLVETGDTVPVNGWVYSLPFEDGIVDDAFSTRWICRRYYELTGRKADGAKEIAGLADSDEAARKLFEEYGARLARFAVSVLQRFDSHTLVLGGNIALAYHLFGSSMRRELDRLACEADVRISALGQEAALTGAASLFI